MFRREARASLERRGWAHGVSDREVHVAEGDVTVTAAELAERLALAVFVDGDLTVSGGILIDDNQALIVTGAVRCESLWIAEGRLSAKTVDVALVATFGCWADDMHGFEVDAMSAGVRCAPSEEPPACLKSARFTHTIITTALDEDKLFGWIVDADPGAVFGALQRGEVVDDDWCRAHKELVQDPTLRAHLGLATIGVANE